MSLEKTTTRMEISNQTRMINPNTVPFDCGEDEDYDGRAHVLFLDKSIWDDLDNPQVITVTIEPGDLLNDS